MALLSEEEQAVGSQAYKKDDATDGSQDSLVSRLKRNFSPSSPLSKKLTDPWSGFYVPFASPRDWNSGKGLQLVLTTEEQVQFIKECNNLGLVSREYMVLVHVPDCIDTSDYQLSGSLFEAGRGGYDQIEGARTANHHHHQGGSGALSGAGERSTKKFTNPLLRQAMERREQRFKDLSAKKKISDIPRCIKQHPLLRNSNDSLFSGEFLRPEGELMACLVPQRSVQGDSDQHEKTLKIVNLFTPTATKKPQGATGSEGSCCQKMCPSCKVPESEKQKSEDRHPWANPAPLLTLTQKRLFRATLSTPGVSAASVEEGQMRFMYSLMAVGRMPTAMETLAELEGDEAGTSRGGAFAWYKVTTSSATEEQIRASFAFSGMPVVGDPMYNTDFAKKLETLYQEDQQAKLEGHEEQGSKKDYLSRSLVSSQKKAKVKEAGILHFYQSAITEGTLSGQALSCVGVSYPSPRERRNTSVLSMLLNTVTPLLQKRLRLFGGKNPVAVTPSGENTTQPSEGVTIGLQSRFSMESLGLVNATAAESQYGLQSLLAASRSPRLDAATAVTPNTFSLSLSDWQALDRASTGGPPQCILCGSVGHSSPTCPSNPAADRAEVIPALAAGSSDTKSVEHEEEGSDAIIHVRTAHRSALHSPLATEHKDLDLLGRTSPSERESLVPSGSSGFATLRSTIGNLIDSDGQPGKRRTESPNEAKMLAIHNRWKAKELQEETDGDFMQQRPSTKKRPVAKGCPLCGGNHGVEQCPKVFTGEEEGAGAKRVGAVHGRTAGNWARQNSDLLKEAAKQMPQALFCRKCGEYGHWLHECRHVVPGAFRGECMICRVPGVTHSMSECPSRVPLPAGGEYLETGIMRSFQERLQAEAKKKNKSRGRTGSETKDPSNRTKRTKILRQGQSRLSYTEL